jgi:hypothetical protein
MRVEEDSKDKMEQIGALVSRWRQTRCREDKRPPWVDVVRAWKGS